MDSLEPISEAEHEARLSREVAIARHLGFVGALEYPHVFRRSGGATYCLAPVIEQDMLIVYANAFSRDAAGEDFTLEAMIAHERGHQLLYRHERLRRVLPEKMSEATEEALASMLGALIVDDSRDKEDLELKAIWDLVRHGMEQSDARRAVEERLRLLRRFL